MTRIAITGTPGTGKTEIAGCLSKITGIDVLGLGPLLERAKTGHDKGRGSDIIDTGILSKEIRSLSKESFIIESHMVHLASKDDIDFCVVLSTSPGELRKRLEIRGWGERKINENVMAEQVKVCLGEAMDQGHRIIVCDTTGKTPEQCAREIAERVC